MTSVNTVYDAASYEAANGGQLSGLFDTEQVMGKNDFLTLLVSQLQNQDPFEPMKDTEFVAQLAQFSSLEQLQNLNTNVMSSTELDYLLSQTISNTLATQLIGKEITASGNSIELSSENKPNLSFKLDGFASNIKINIYSSDGSLIKTLEETELDSGIHDIAWDGKNESGSRVGNGTYTFSIEAENATGDTIRSTPLISGYVEGVSYADGSAYLIVDGRKIIFGNILEINEG
ncbi:MAG: flagellar hook capping protein [candidate division Zixibacteria bacterium]|nr:flagellar hook capping protein [candidate division Zixibacteria bacterium]